MAVALLQRLAPAGPVPIYAVAGAGGQEAVEDLSLDPAISIEASPRHASLLLVAGAIRDEDRRDLWRLHDQLPHPRATMWWRCEPDPAFEAPIQVAVEAAPAGAVAGTYRDLLAGTRRSENDLLPDEPPAPWRGKGDHGQGGEGMMGGKPYGRPLAMTDEDRRDALALDAYTTRFGPFLPMLPPGLLLEMTLQGDVVQSARVLRAPFKQKPEQPPRRIARLLRVLGLPALAARLLRAAHGDARGFSGLDRRLRWSGATNAIPAGLGQLGAEDVRRRLGRWRQEARGESSAAPPAVDGRLVDLLPGLEWSEAILVANSFEGDVLRGLCPIDPTDGGERDQS